MDYMKIADKTWPMISRLMGGHTAVYKATGGRIGHRLPVLRQNLLLDHVGAKSGVKRTSPLLYAKDGRNLILVASKGGYPKNPAWFHNLKANPDTTVQVRSEVRKVHARVAGPDERPRLWQKAVDVYPGYRGYQDRADREIPVVVLEPRGGKT